MLGAVKLLDEKDFTPVPKLRLIHMPTASYMGKLYADRPKREEFQTPHPQARPLAEIYKVMNKHDCVTGVFAVPASISYDDSITRVFLSQVKKITNVLPKKNDPRSIYYLDEVVLFPQALDDVIDIRQDKKTCAALKRGVRARYGSRSLEFK